MIRAVSYVFAGIVVIHGLIHLLGFVSYWPLATVTELPYKTTLFGGRWDIGSTGMRLYAVAWLAAAVSLVSGGVVQRFGQPWWLTVMLGATALSLLITLADWGNARIGAPFSGVLLVGLLLALGLRMSPAPFALLSLEATGDRTIGSLADVAGQLPPPVERYFKAVGADPVPMVDSAVVSARGTTRLNGLTMPSRLLFIHDAGQGYRHYIESTVYRVPLLKVNERYVDGRAVLELPVGTVVDKPKVDMAANLGLWGESIWLPTIYLTDDRVRWEALDENSARLIVPFVDSSGDTDADQFTVYFDSGTGLVSRMETMRFKGADDVEKTPWILEAVEWSEFNGLLIPSLATATWADEGTPWLVVDIDEVVYNVDVDDYLRQRGS